MHLGGHDFSSLTSGLIRVWQHFTSEELYFEQCLNIGVDVVNY